MTRIMCIEHCADCQHCAHDRYLETWRCMERSRPIRVLATGNVLAPDYCGFNPYTDDVAPGCPLPEVTNV
jgi:hypothetical protein